MVNATLLITRPIEDGQKLQSFLQPYPIHSILCPLLAIHPLPFTLPSPIDYTGIILTSLHGFTALLQRDKTTLNSLKQLPLYVVGTRIQRAAQENHWSGPIYSFEDGDTMYHQLHTLPSHVKLLYLTGKYMSHDFTKLLLPHHILCHTVITYEAKAITSLPHPIKTDLRHGIITHCCFYSTRTAAIFISLIDYALPTLTCLCISQQVADQLKEAFRVQVADTPNNEAMKQLILQHCTI